MGGAHSQVQASITSPTSPPYVAKQLTALFHTQPLFSFLVYGNVVPTHILVKAQPSTRSTGPRSPTRLGIRSQDLGLPNEYSLGHCGLSAASSSQAGTTYYSQLLTLQHSTKLLLFFLYLFFFFYVDLSLSSKFRPGSARPHLN